MAEVEQGATGGVQQEVPGIEIRLAGVQQEPVPVTAREEAGTCLHCLPISGYGDSGPGH